MREVTEGWMLSIEQSLRDLAAQQQKDESELACRIERLARAADFYCEVYGHNPPMKTGCLVEVNRCSLCGKHRIAEHWKEPEDA